MLKIYREPKEEKEKDVYLKLERSPGYIVLCACDADGVGLLGGNLIRFYPNGEVKTYGGISHNLGLKLATDEHLEITKL